MLQTVALPQDHQRYQIADGDAGTAQTIAHMQRLVEQGKRDRRVRQFLLTQIISDCPQKDYRCYLEAAFRYVRDNIKYVYDPNSVELLETVWSVIDPENGVHAQDCDGKVTTLAVFAEQLGFPAAFVTIKADATHPDEYSHVYMKVKLPGGWVAADPTMPDKPLGWEPPGDYPRKSWPATVNGEGADMLGACCSSCAKQEIGMSGLAGLLGVGCCGTTPLGRWYPQEAQGLSGLGVVSNDPSDFVQAVIDGTIYDEMTKGHQRLLENITYTAQARNTAEQLPANTPNRQNAIAAANYAYNAVQVEARSFNELMAKYNSLVGDIRTYSLGAAQPRFLSGLGVAPLVAAMVIIPALAAGAIACAIFFATWKSNQKESADAINSVVSQLKPILDFLSAHPELAPQIFDFLKTLGAGPRGPFGEISDTLKWFAIAGGIGLVAYIGVMALRKRGTI